MKHISEFKDSNIVIAIDLDGTLLNENHVISNEAKNILIHAAEKYKLCIATGRMYASAKRFHEDLGLNTPVICYNGAMVMFHNEMLFHTCVEERNVQEIVQQDFDECRLLCFSNDTLYAEAYDDRVEEYCSRTGVEFHIRSRSDIMQYNITKFILSGPSEKLDIYEKYHCFGSDQLYTPRSKPHYLECMNSAVSKCMVIKAAEKIYNISAENIIAFGDSYNDIELLASVGYSVAVENAAEDVKKIADNICGSNTCDGVARFIEEYLL